MKTENFVRGAFAVTVLAAVITAVIMQDHINQAAITAWIDDLGIWGPVAFVAAFAFGAIIFLPSPLFALASGLLFGPVWGAVINIAGSAGGAALAFLTARYFTASWRAHRREGTLYRIIQGIELEGWRSVALMRLAPFLPYNLVNYAFGVTRISFTVYIVTTVICKMPAMLAYAWLGHAGEAALDGNNKAVGYALLGLGMLAVIAFLPHLIARIRNATVQE